MVDEVREEMEGPGLNRMAAVPLSFTHKGKPLKLSPLSTSDLGKMEQWLQDRPMRVVEQQLERNSHLISDEMRDKLIYEAMKEGQRVSIRDVGAIAAAFSSLEGSQFVMHLMLQTEQPGMTEADVEEVLTEATLLRMQEFMDRVSGMKEVVAGESSAGNQEEIK